MSQRKPDETNMPNGASNDYDVTAAYGLHRGGNGSSGKPQPYYQQHHQQQQQQHGNQQIIETQSTIASEANDSYLSNLDEDSYMALHNFNDAGTSVTGHAANYHTMIAAHTDATDTVHEMHLALLYLLSNPEEFKRALEVHPARGATTLAEWNAEYDNESLIADDSASLYTAAEPPNYVSTTNNNQIDSSSNTNQTTPLPFVVFADDAEVVLPQAHTASQLFGIERLEGIELEAAAGIPAISQLFLRWLALMPSGDHLNIIDPPGLTVMRIAGGRYRVTAAHRVVWTWMNEFVPLSDGTSMKKHSNDESVNTLQLGDLVTMTIVDVFETDNQGKLLSYCPTFDNRAIFKTHQTAETIRKSSTRLLALLGQAKNSQMAKLVMAQAKTMAQRLRRTVDEAVHNYHSPRGANMARNAGDKDDMASFTGYDAPMSGEEAAASRFRLSAASSYLADDDTERHEV